MKLKDGLTKIMEHPAKEEALSRKVMEGLAVNPSPSFETGHQLSCTLFFLQKRIFSFIAGMFGALVMMGSVFVPEKVIPLLCLSLCSYGVSLMYGYWPVFSLSSVVHDALPQEKWSFVSCFTWMHRVLWVFFRDGKTRHKMAAVLEFVGFWIVFLCCAGLFIFSLSSVFFKGVFGL